MKKIDIKINSIEELINTRRNLMKELNNQINKLEEYDRKPFKFYSERKTTINTLKTIIRKLTYLDSIIIDGSTFKTEEFAPFIAEVLSQLGEKQEAIKQEIITKKIGRKIYFKDIYFIQKENQKPNYIPTIYDGRDLYAFENSYASNNVIILKDKNSCPFNRRENLKEKYQFYPKLKDIFYQLIDLKIKNPELTDEERMNITLESIKNRNEKQKNLTLN